MDITLEQLLQSRDARAARQAALLKEFPLRTLLCLTVIMPGPEKRSPRSLCIAQAAVSAVRDAFSPEYEELRDLETGYEGFFVISCAPGLQGAAGEAPFLAVKRVAAALEDTHPLGRLFDLDVITPDGPVSRSAIGAPERRCLICDRAARLCMREHRHSYQELLSAIDALLNAARP